MTGNEQYRRWEERLFSIRDRDDDNDDDAADLQFLDTIESIIRADEHRRSMWLDLAVILGRSTVPLRGEGLGNAVDRSRSSQMMHVDTVNGNRRRQLFEHMMARPPVDPRRELFTDERLRWIISRDEPLPRYEPSPAYDDGRYLSEPTSLNGMSQTAVSRSTSLQPPAPPRYTRRPSPSTGRGKSMWPKGSFPDGPTVVLSLDAAGGDRTSQQLDSLEELMCTISRSLGRICRYGKGPNVLKPCQVFHLITGSGTGGLIAILLGRLEMSVQEVKDFYNDNEEYIFGPLRELGNVKTRVEPGLTDMIWEVGEGIGFLPKSVRTKATTRLEEKIAWIVKIRNKGTELMHPGNPGLGKVLVTAVHHTTDVSKTTKLRSYPSSSDEGLRPSIVEAARATMAHVSFFKPAKIQGTAGYWTGTPAKHSNPIGLVHEEYPRLSSRDVVVSVGVGIAGETQAQSARKADLFGTGKPTVVTFDDVMDWNARLCAKIERDKNGARGRLESGLDFSSETSHRHFRLHSRGNCDFIAKEAGNVIKDIRRECIRREKERQEREGQEQQRPVEEAPAEN